MAVEAVLSELLSLLTGKLTGKFQNLSRAILRFSSVYAPLVQTTLNGTGNNRESATVTERRSFYKEKLFRPKQVESICSKNSDRLFSSNESANWFPGRDRCASNDRSSLRWG